MNSFRDLMNLVNYADKEVVYQPTPQEEQRNEELMEAMRRVEALFDY